MIGLAYLFAVRRPIRPTLPRLAIDQPDERIQPMAQFPGMDDPVDGGTDGAGGGDRGYGGGAFGPTEVPDRPSRQALSAGPARPVLLAVSHHPARAGAVAACAHGLGATTVLAGDGEAAVRLLGDIRADAVLIDVCNAQGRDAALALFPGLAGLWRRPLAVILLGAATRPEVADLVAQCHRHGLPRPVVLPVPLRPADLRLALAVREVWHGTGG